MLGDLRNGIIVVLYPLDHFKYEDATHENLQEDSSHVLVPKNSFVSCIFAYHRANRNLHLILFSFRCDSKPPQCLNQASKYFFSSYRTFKFVVRFS